jgi:iron complex transport system substrate-binding protein
MTNEGQVSAFGDGSRYAIINDTFGFKSADDQIIASTHGQSVSYEYVLKKIQISFSLSTVLKLSVVT